MNDTFTLSKTQLQAAKENGLICEHFGPVEGTQDIYHVRPTNLQNLVASILKMGKGMTAGAKVVQMFPGQQKRTA